LDCPVHFESRGMATAGSEQYGNIALAGKTGAVRASPSARTILTCPLRAGRRMGGF
jgi:hypothetical protein